MTKLFQKRHMACRSRGLATRTSPSSPRRQGADAGARLVAAEDGDGNDGKAPTTPSTTPMIVEKAPTAGRGKE